MTEQHLGNGRIQVFRDAERYCVWNRHGLAHEPHEWHYARTDALTGDIVTGNYSCDGLPESEAGKPYPLPPFDVAERAKSGSSDTGRCCWETSPSAGAGQQRRARHRSALWSAGPASAALAPRMPSSRRPASGSRPTSGRVSDGDHSHA